ncbi:MAG: carbohydrate porin [Candidatus Omnitrophica bacterium]|nr:carbohydrate porin [Candidatus Omnitrophota bacterium]
MIFQKIKVYFVVCLSIFILPLLTAIFPSEALALDSPAAQWSKIKSDLQEKGVSFDVVYTADAGFNVKGGLERGSAYMDNLDLSLTLDTEKLNLWQGGTFLIYGIINGGNRKLTERFVGDIQTASNIEAPRSSHLMELWYQQNLFEDKLSILAGMHDLNTEFDVTEYGGLFINGSFGIQPTMTGNFTAPVFPLGSLAVRVKVQPVENLELLTAVFVGDPGSLDEGNRHGTYFNINKKGGLLNINEADYHYKISDFIGKGEALPGTVKLGGWYLGRNFEDLVELDDNSNPVPHDGNWGIYAVIDQMIYREQGEQGLGAFLQMSAVPTNRNTVSRYVGFGFNYKGLVPGRDDDTVGVAYNIASISDDAREADGLESAEKVLEITYLIQITPFLTLQPDIQFITNPGGDPEVKNATVAMLRGSISF